MYEQSPEMSAKPMKRGAMMGKKPLKKTEIRKELFKKGKKALVKQEIAEGEA